MSDKQDAEERKSRVYNSPLRRQKARATKEKVLDVATRQLKEKGFADINFMEVAKEAGVALQTVYRVCGSKKKLLQLIWAQMEKDGTAQISGPETILHEQQALYKTAGMHLEMHIKGNKLLGKVHNTLHSYQENLAEHEDAFKGACQGFAREMAKEGLLRPDLDIDTAAQVYWAMLSPQLQARFIKELGWSEERFAALFYEVIGAAILKKGAVPDLLSQWRP